MRLRARHFVIIAAVAAAGAGAAYTVSRPTPPPVYVPVEQSTQVQVDHSNPLTFAGMPAMYPDPTKTPGATDPNVTQDDIETTICSKSFKTGSVRDQTTTAAQKAQTYDLYGIQHPSPNTGQDQRCELDHLISLENGGSDAIENIWPECGPDWPDASNPVSVGQRWFKLKDAVENYVHNGICLDVPNAKMSMGPSPSKALTLQEGQYILTHDWYACYQHLLSGEDCN